MLFRSKLPLIFYNIDVPTILREKVADEIMKSENSIVNYLAILTYNSYKKNNTPVPTLYKGKIPPLDNIKFKCNNRLNSEFPEQIVIYKDDRNVYCFNIFELWKQINNKNFINPYSNKKFSESYILRFLEIYNIKFLEDSINTESTKIKNTLTTFLENFIKRQSLAPNLIDIIKKDILLLETLDTPKIDSGKHSSYCSNCSQEMDDDVGFIIVSPNGEGTNSFCSPECATKYDDDDDDDDYDDDDDDDDEN